MTADIPAPGPSGYQPAPGEGLAHVDVEVRPSWGFQTVGISGRYEFPEPRPFGEALPAIDELYSGLRDIATEKVNDLVSLREQHESAASSAQLGRQRQAAAAPAAAPAAPAQQAATAAPAPQASDSWQLGTKPNGKGTFKFLPTSVVSGQAFIEQAKAAIAFEGYNPDDVIVFDDRTGQYGLESGKQAYAAGKVKARKDSPLDAALDGKSIAYVDFNEHDGSISVHVTKDAKAAAAIVTRLAGAGSEIENLPF